MSDVPPPPLREESQGCQLIPLYYLLSCVFCLVLLLFRSYLFFCLLAHSPEFFSRKFLNIFCQEIGLCDSCLAARRSKLVGGVCSMLPYAPVVAVD